MNQQTLKDLLKPPIICREDTAGFYTDGGSGKEFLARFSVLSSVLENNDSLLADFAHFTAASLNEKWERDFGEPARWIRVADSDDWQCPICNTEFYLNGHSPEKLNYNYCPHCGKRLLSLEEKL
ncbi:MAG: hypothetical protein LBU85_01085 [Treponema sp.]|jgi:DNA-directed RNA polymerase subunit RPC12/RpoP|nr:hypothetical protein [Treponema sp.]